MPPSPHVCLSLFESSQCTEGLQVSYYTSTFCHLYSISPFFLSFLSFPLSFFHNLLVKKKESKKKKVKKEPLLGREKMHSDMIHEPKKKRTKNLVESNIPSLFVEQFVCPKLVLIPVYLILHSSQAHSLWPSKGQWWSRCGLQPSWHWLLPQSSVQLWLHDAATSSTADTQRYM